jgi:hypothetical protein
MELQSLILGAGLLLVVGAVAALSIALWRIWDTYARRRDR